MSVLPELKWTPIDFSTYNEPEWCGTLYFCMTIRFRSWCKWVCGSKQCNREISWYWGWQTRATSAGKFITDLAINILASNNVLHMTIAKTFHGVWFRGSVCCVYRQYIYMWNYTLPAVCTEEEDCSSGAAPAADDPQAPPDGRRRFFFPGLLFPPGYSRPRPLSVLPRGGHCCSGWLFWAGDSGLWTPLAVSLSDSHPSLCTHAHHCRYSLVHLDSLGAGAA